MGLAVRLSNGAYGATLQNARRVEGVKRINVDEIIVPSGFMEM